MKFVILVDESTFVCDECSQAGYVIVMEEQPSAILRHLRKVGSKCWDHFTPELMALQEVKL